MDGYLGEIRMFAGSFAPRGWAFCNGQLLSIASNGDLFTILGTTYGGNGTSDFALPDFRGRVPVGPGSGTGLPTVSQGQKIGAATHTLTVNQMPAHTHGAQLLINCTNDQGDQPSPGGNILGSTQQDTPYNRFAPNSTMNPNGASIAMQVTGGNQPHNNIQPSLGVQFIICIQGLFPTS